MTIGEFLTQYAGAFFGFLGAALAAGAPGQEPGPGGGAGPPRPRFPYRLPFRAGSGCSDQNL